eukprot:1143960-Pelagomonas_calceolata.AAC.1
MSDPRKWRSGNWNTNPTCTHKQMVEETHATAWVAVPMRHPLMGMLLAPGTSSTTGMHLAPEKGKRNPKDHYFQNRPELKI